MRLDVYLVKENITESRQKAQDLIKGKKVLVNGNIVTKPSYKVKEKDIITLKEKNRYVSRGGYKLQGALEAFNIDVKGKVAVDVGASTGGFTDCLLQHGAKRVYAIDVAENQLHPKLKNNKSVVELSNTDIKNIKDNTIPEKVDIIVADVSTESIKNVLPKLTDLLKEGGIILYLLKPQYEAGYKNTKDGIVKDKELREQILKETLDWIKNDNTFNVLDYKQSVLPGREGNIEYFLLISKKTGG